MEKVNSSDINALGSVSTDFRTLKTIQMIIIPLCVMIDVFGLGTNSVNIICFVSQGFKEPVNISLAGIIRLDVYFTHECLISILRCQGKQTWISVTATAVRLILDGVIRCECMVQF